MPSPEDIKKNPRLLAQIPYLVIVFLTAIGRYDRIRLALVPRGYDGTVHLYMWDLLFRICGLRPGAMAPSLGVQARDAEARITAWERSTLRVGRAALKAQFRDAHDFLFSGLDESSDVGPVVAVSILLDRLDALEQDPERKKTRKTDHAALAKLESRGITAAERVRMREQLALVTRSADLGIASDAITPTSIDDDEREKNLEELASVYEEWCEIARVEIHNRNDLIRLGIARRRRSSKKGASDSTQHNPTVTVAPAAPPSIVVAPAAKTASPKPVAALPAPLPLATPAPPALPTPVIAAPLAPDQDNAVEPLASPEPHDGPDPLEASGEHPTAPAAVPAAAPAVANGVA